MKGRKKNDDRDMMLSFRCGLFRMRCPWKTPRIPRNEALELAQAHVIQAHPSVVSLFKGAAV